METSAFSNIINLICLLPSHPALNPNVTILVNVFTTQEPHNLRIGFVSALPQSSFAGLSLQCGS
jgi:hypothetical protein